MTRVLIALAAASFAASPALTQSIELGGIAQLRAGYGSNPFLQPGRNKAVAVIGGTIAPQLTRRTERGVTTLLASYDRTEYLSEYDNSDTALISLSHDEKLSERFRLYGNLGYLTSTNPFVSDLVDADLTDVLTVGQRTRRLYGNVGSEWTPNARDTLTLSVNASHATYSRRTLNTIPTSNYDQIGGQARFVHAFSPRTRVGLQLGVSAVDSKSYADSQAYQPSIVVVQQLNDNWTFDGSAGLIFQHRSSFGGVGGDWSTSVGFNASLCGEYPRHRVCLTGSRDTSPSGFGGLRRDTTFGVDWTYTIDERSRLNARGFYQISDGQDFVLPVKDRFGQASVNYSRDVTQRIAVGGGANYQWREYQRQRSARAFTATVNLTYRLGRLGT